MVRLAEYLQKNSIDFLCVCSIDSYIFSDLRCKGVGPSQMLVIENSPDYYYLSEAKRKLLVGKISSSIGCRPARIVSFCMRDLYTVRAVCAELAVVAVVHLVLHIQDDLYLGQTILEKILYQFTGRRLFGNLKIIHFNRALLTRLNKNGGLICMADLIAEVWRRNFGISIPNANVVPLPSFTAPIEESRLGNNNRKIIWIGRLVDFKIPALIAMVDFLAVARDYSLTIIGDGDRSGILAHMKVLNVASDRVKFTGEIAYADLVKIVPGHSIGYAMGTSLVELARFRIPVIVALASYTHSYFRRPICGGLFYDKPRGCDGSELAIFSENQISLTIADAISKIESDWIGVAESCYKYACDNYSAEKNFAVYKRIIDQAELLLGSDKYIQIPKASILRSVLFNIQANVVKVCV